MRGQWPRPAGRGVRTGDSGGTAAPRSAVVVNPSKQTNLGRMRRTLTEMLSAAGWPEPLWLETSVADPGQGQTRRAIEEGVELVFVWGGDGTVMACVSALVGTDVALAILPAGTGNLLAANLGLSGDLTAAIEVALERRQRRLDVGVCDGQVFTVMAGMGFDAELIRSTSESTKARIGWLAYLLGGARHLRDRPMSVSIRIDGQPPLRRRARTVLVANVGRLQGGVRLFNDAQPDDGYLDVAVLTPHTIRHWATLMWGVLRRRTRVPRMEVFQGQRVEVVSNRAQPRELDGDVIDPGRSLRIEVRPGALLLCVPGSAEREDLAMGVGAVTKRATRRLEQAQ